MEWDTDPETLALKAATWVWVKLQGTADSMADALTGRLVDVVKAKLPGSAGMAELEAEAHGGTDEPLTRQQLAIELHKAGNQDAEFAERLTEIVSKLEQLQTGQYSAERDVNVNNSSGTQNINTGNGLQNNFLG